MDGAVTADPVLRALDARVGRVVPSTVIEGPKSLDLGVLPPVQRGDRDGTGLRGRVGVDGTDQHADQTDHDRHDDEPTDTDENLVAVLLKQPHERVHRLVGDGPVVPVTLLGAGFGELRPGPSSDVLAELGLRTDPRQRILAQVEIAHAPGTIVGVDDASGGLAVVLDPLVVGIRQLVEAVGQLAVGDRAMHRVVSVQGTVALTARLAITLVQDTTASAAPGRQAGVLEHFGVGDDLGVLRQVPLLMLDERVVWFTALRALPTFVPGLEALAAVPHSLIDDVAHRLPLPFGWVGCCPVDVTVNV